MGIGDVGMGETGRRDLFELGQNELGEMSLGEMGQRDLCELRQR